MRMGTFWWRTVRDAKRAWVRHRMSHPKVFSVQQEQRLRGIAETRIWTRCFLTSVPVVSLMRQSVLG